jgi:hypothetical protein
MAFTEVSAAGKNAVGTVGKAGQQKVRLYPAGAHYPDRPDVGRVLQAGDTGSVGCGITAPVTEKAQNFRFFFHRLSVLSF